MPPAADAAPALRLAAAVGPFFAVDLLAEPGGGATGGVTGAAIGDGTAENPVWQRFSDLLGPGSDLLLARVADSRARLAAYAGIGPDRVELRVAGSLWFQGWAGRLVSPWLAAAVLGGVVPDVAAEDLLWRAGGGGQPVPVGVRRVPGRAVDASGAGDVARLMSELCVQALVVPLLEATAAACSVARQVLVGNLASAVAGAGAQLSQAEPSVAALTRAVCDRLLTTGLLSGQGTYHGSRFARRTCCLMYRLPGAGLCGDCVLARR